MFGKGAPFDVFEALLLSVVLVSHDNDHKVPRTLDEIFGLNKMLATAMEKIFIKKGIPVVPSLGEFTNIHLWNIIFIYDCINYRQ
jgi:uncharacterized membrane protein